MLYVVTAYLRKKKTKGLKEERKDRMGTRETECIRQQRQGSSQEEDGLLQSCPLAPLCTGHLHSLKPNTYKLICIKNKSICRVNIVEHTIILAHGGQGKKDHKLEPA